MKLIETSDESSFELVKDKIEDEEVKQEFYKECVIIPKKNKEMIKKIKKSYKSKILIRYGTPILLFTLLSSLSIASNLKKEHTDIYSLKKTIVSDNLMSQEIDNNLYTDASITLKIDKKYKKVDSTKDKVNMVIKNNTRTVELKILFDEDNNIDINEATANNLFNKNLDVFENLDTKEIEENYDELINSIVDYLINSDNHEIDEYMEIKDEVIKMLKDNKTEIISTIYDYSKVDTIETGFKLPLLIIIQFCSELYFLAITFLLMYQLSDPKLKFLTRHILSYDDDGNLLEDELLETISFKSYKFAYEEYIKAEEQRRSNVKRLALANLDESDQKLFI